MERIRPKIQEVATFVGSRNVADLERVATAFFLLREGLSSKGGGVERLTSIKPHVSRDEASRAHDEIREFIDAQGWSES